MIASLRGTLLEKNEETVVLEVANVGYSVMMSPSAIAALPPLGEEVLLYVAESVAMYGGGVTLYGFQKQEERRLFDALRANVPGTGAKKALEFLDKAGKSLPDFRRAVIDKDNRALVSMFGFTAKTAEKIVAGLQDKIEAAPPVKGRHGAPAASSSFEETIQGLLSLGYRDTSAREAAQLARTALGSDATSQAMIREALRHLGRRS